MGIDAQMLAVCHGEVSKDHVRETAVAMRKMFRDAVTVWPPAFWSFEDEGRHCLEIVGEYTQDGPSIFPGEDETLVEVHMGHSYYGAGYERGCPFTAIAIARFVEHHLAPCSIYYGGDSSGVLAEPFGAAERAEMERHAWSKSGSDYRSDSSFAFGARYLCTFCGCPVTQYGSGGNYEAHVCTGCGTSAQRRGDLFVWGAHLPDFWDGEETPRGAKEGLPPFWEASK
jgi:hypothetical protein